MIVDMRVYTYQPAQFMGFVKAYVEAGHDIVSKHLGVMAGVFISASGVANRTLQFFAYEDNDHRDACRRSLRADPEWSTFIRGAAAAISVQENTILQPTSHSPLQDLGALRGQVTAPQAPDRLFEMRTRTFMAGGAALATAGEGAEEVRIRSDAGENAIYQFTADTGLDDRVLSFAAYGSAAERDSVARRLKAVPQMEALRERLQPLLVNEMRELWQPLPCSPLR